MDALVFAKEKSSAELGMSREELNSIRIVFKLLDAEGVNLAPRTIAAYRSSLVGSLTVGDHDIGHQFVHQWTFH